MVYTQAIMYSIGQIARMANVSNRTLRYYEELGLIAPETRGQNRYRYYSESHLRRLNTIKMLQDSGFALKEIVAALSPALDPSGQITYTGQEMARKIYHALSEQRAKLEQKQRELAQSAEELTRTMKALEDCFGCRISANLKDCAQCEKGAPEVSNMGHRFNQIKAQEERAS